jgi:hypothetical protein
VAARQPQSAQRWRRVGAWPSPRFLGAAGLALVAMLFSSRLRASQVRRRRFGPVHVYGTGLHFLPPAGSCCWQAARSWWRQRSDPDATLLILWLAGTLVFATSSIGPPTPSDAAVGPRRRNAVLRRPNPAR